jgi:hypothetical protein
MPIYVYAITPDIDADLPAILGVAGAELERVAARGLAAVVSDFPAATIRAERKHLAAAYAVARVLQAAGDALPVAFGTIAPSRDFVADLLAEHAAALRDRLDRLKGAVEMGLRVRLEGLDPMAFLVERSPELRRARDRAFGRGRPPGYDERINLGRLCEDALGRFCETVASRVIDLVAPCCREITRLPLGKSGEIANLAALVSREQIAPFEAAIEAAAAEQEDALVFNLSGPWPPHHFAQLDLPVTPVHVREKRYAAGR